jgi:6-phosphogluconate dehydrogenase
MRECGIANLLLAPYFKQIADEYQQALRDVVAYAVQNGIPVPTSLLLLPTTTATVLQFCQLT